jgi:hypothetical protein
LRFKKGDIVVLSEEGKKYAFTSKKSQKRRLFGKIVGFSYTEGCYRVKWDGVQTIETISETYLDPILIPTKDIVTSQQFLKLKKRIGEFSEKIYKPLRLYLDDCEALGKTLDKPKIYYKASGLRFTLITNLRELLEMISNLEVETT